MKQKRQTALITGASSGIGLATAKLLAANGYIVYGLCRRDMAVHEGITWLTCDVTNQEQVNAAVAAIIHNEGNINLVVQSAGYGIAGAVEANTDAEITRLFDVNLMGSVRVLRAVLPHMRKQKSGKIIQLGSVAGHFGLPFQGYYSASKFAVAGLCEALRAELHAFNIQAVVVEPGDTATAFVRTLPAEPITEYEQATAHAIDVMSHDEQQGDSPEKCAKLILKLARKKRLPSRIVVGADYKLMVKAKKLLPHRFVEWILRRKYIG